jgi:hypothetical protein
MLESRTLLAGASVGIYASLDDASEADRLSTGRGQFFVKRSGPTDQPLTLNYYVRSTSTATADEDFKPLSGSVTIPAGARKAFINLYPNDDLVHEGSEKVVLSLRTGDNQVVRRSASVTIADDDAAPPAGWWQSAWHYRTPLAVRVDAMARSDLPVEFAINFTSVLQSLGAGGKVNLNSIRVLEVNSDGSQIIDDDVPFQFDRSAAFDARLNASGTLVLMLKGETAADTVRKFHVYFDTAGLFPAPRFQRVVTVADGVSDAGAASLRITTPSATYFYNKTGGAFSSILDRDGNDWLGYDAAAGSGSAGEFRGMPNLRPDSFHAGDDLAIRTRLVAAGALKATIESNDAAGNAIRWEIYPGFARATVLKMNQHYYFMYEGTPGGSVNGNELVVRSNGNATSIGKPFAHTQGMGAHNDQSWLYFHDPSAGSDGRYLFLAHHSADQLEDSYWLMDGRMTVFGFGRHNVPGLAPERLLSGQNVFTIGLHDGGADFAAASDHINGSYRNVSVKLGTAAAI